MACSRPAMIRFEQVTKSYAGQSEPVLGDFSVRIRRGCFCVVVGRSGAGKSTALKLVNRMLEPDRGEILVDGTDVRDQNPFELRRGIGYVLQRIGLLPHLSVAENVALVPRLLGWSEERIAKRVNELLSLMKLEPAEYRQRLPAELSGGQQQRVGLARALAGGPRLLLMDEPFGALDALTRADLRHEVTGIHRELGLTTLLVTHDVVEALLLADEVIVLDRGRLVQHGTPAELVRNPASDFVAQLLASPELDFRKLETVLGGAPP